MFTDEVGLMNEHGRDRKWPFAEGGEVTLAVMTAVWVTAVFLHKKLFHPVTKIVGALVTGLWLLMLYFFRDPNRQVCVEPGLVVSPADGEVMAIVRETEQRYLQADVVRISIFLSVLNVHVQRAPLGGVVTLVDHRPGQFLQAFRPEASDVNEFVAMVVETGYGRILVKQIAGILARRCVNYMQPGDDVTTGQRFGLIRFGSRVDLYLPADAQLLMQVGDKALGGITPVARLYPKDV